ncbi:collagenase [Vibrio europaeus]|uniref:microbial collagenase n=1 Tax=Vibrio europaeus TaxID=300876 RepID=A0A178J7C0_9VIBR|nr:collagenase [Vibrio europaeus]MDC5705430.1 collagenase [Vibrio europaeus]MDC5710709.1 collagenase [Vibrio europaeus]MDC5715799.1 collagenase [Vibrio europaeus]MDC5719960.1 collagenase [Vibrio europaeus]MDC5724153.1 collagenase [Vibrio europaeus]
MELKKLTIAVAGALFSLNVYAASEPVPQYVDRSVLHDHEHHGVEEHEPDNAPKKTLTQKPEPTFKMFSAAADEAAVTCDVETFATSNSTALISAITAQGASCVNKLFSAESRVQEAAFESSNMFNVAKHTVNIAKAYQGGGSDELEALFLFLRAGYYAEFYNNNVSFLSWVTPAVKEAVDAFVANANFYESSDAHGKVLREVIITMDSASLEHAYLDVITQWLNRWNSDYAQHWYMRDAVNGVFTVLFGGQWNDQYVQAIGSQTALVDALAKMALNRDSITRADEFMTANAGREMARLLKYSGTAIEAQVKAKVTEVFSQYEMYGYGDTVWLAAADTASYHSDCSQFGICNFEQQLKSLVLAQSYTCSPTIRILSQNMTQTQHQAACEKMGFEEGYFHTRLETGNQPVADDHNTQLQVNIFDSSDDYGKYAGPIFDISTNNGGMYLEGNPALPGNIPNFVAYEASYANPDHFVWNLEHEYVHYLDGRFDMYGDFSHPTEKVVWWSEGVAEYVANEDNNPKAIETIKDGSTYTLSEIFETTYDGFDVDRIYRWGYLAVRFMFERHMDDVNRMLVETRSGNWSQYKVIINQWAVQYQAEFEQWQQQLVSGGAESPTAVINVSNEGKVGESISFSSTGSSDKDGQITKYLWDFGDSSTSSEANPSHQFNSEGNYTVRLTVTDNDGNTGTTTASIVISQQGGDSSLPTDCAVQSKISGGRLVAGEPACLASESAIWLSIEGVNEHQSMAITSANGTGDLKLEYSNFGWPNEAGSNLHGWSDNEGNSECITIAGQANYWGYLKVSGNFENAAIVVDFDTSSCRP